MKTKLRLLILILVISLKSNCQKANLIIFSENGDSFYAYVNGVKQNIQPETNVKVTGLASNVNVRIEFENKLLPQLKQNMYLEEGFEHTAKIMRDVKQRVKLRYFGQTPLLEETVSGNSLKYHSLEKQDSEDEAKSNRAVKTTNISSKESNTNNNVGNKNSEDVSINVNMAGVGISMNVNNIENHEGTSAQSSSGHTVTTSSSSVYHSDIEESPENNSYTKKKDQAKTARPVKSACAAPMTAVNFSQMKQSIASKPFSETKMSTAKLATKNACLSVNQVKEICKLFSIDNDKLAYAKFAYEYCLEKNKYYLVGDVFSFSSTTDELNKFLDN
jgi:hypothetical protein